MDMKKYLQDLLKLVDGLQAVIITDRDGVPILKIIGDDNTPDVSQKSKFLSITSMALDQASKLGLSASRSIIAYYGNYQVVSLNKLPLVVTFIAQASSNTGMILNLESDLEDILQDIKKAVDVS